MAAAVKRLSKADLIEKVATHTGATKVATAEIIDATIEAIIGSVKKGSEVAIIGFGTFSGSKRKATTGHNPQTGEKIKIAASTRPKFKAGKAFKDALN